MITVLFAFRPAYSLVTTDVIEAACTCLIATVEEASSVNETDSVGERMVLEEFGRCLTRVIDSANNLTGLFTFIDHLTVDRSVISAISASVSFQWITQIVILKQSVLWQPSLSLNIKF